jgi:tRNA(Ile2) C34 agmatinyltransferase TiaS
MKALIGLDDTDNQDSRGTGHLARQIALDLMADFSVSGVTRHQLLVDPHIPYTAHNSSAAIHLDLPEEGVDLEILFERLKRLMLDDFQTGSDPGLCLASGEIPEAITAFGRLAQSLVVKQADALELASKYGLHLQGLGGTRDGVIGALAAVGLAAGGEDGRYIQIGSLRQLTGLQPITRVLAAGVSSVQTLEGHLVKEGLILADKLRPARRNGKPVQFVEWGGDHWQPLKLG